MGGNVLGMPDMQDPIEVQARLSLANMREVVKLSKGNKDVRQTVYRELVRIVTEISREDGFNLQADRRPVVVK